MQLRVIRSYMDLRVFLQQRGYFGEALRQQMAAATAQVAKGVPIEGAVYFDSYGNEVKPATSGHRGKEPDLPQILPMEPLPTSAAKDASGRLVQLVAQSGASWGPVPRELEDEAWPRVLVPEGPSAGQTFSVVCRNGRLEAWEAKYDVQTGRDVAREVATLRPVGPAAPLSSYASTLPLTLNGAGHALVTRPRDPNLYLVVPSASGETLYQVT